MMAENAIKVDHTTIMRWVHQYSHILSRYPIEKGAKVRARRYAWIQLSII
jgi:transposase-like protein